MAKDLVTFKKVVQETNSDRVGDMLVALSELLRSGQIPDDAKITYVSANFGTPRKYEITVEWQVPSGDV
jgi:hypothetical protein